jgi:hypothetical protein
MYIHGSVLRDNQSKQMFLFLFKTYHPITWRDSISQPIAPVSSVAGGANTTMYVGIMYADQGKRCFFADWQWL